MTNKRSFSILVFLLTFLISIVFAGCNKHEHEFSEWKVQQDASCLNAEIQFRFCNCGEVQTRELGNALGHSETEWIIDKDSSCKDFGSKHKECVNCSEILQIEVIEKKEHNMSVWTQLTPATCTQAETKQRICYCGEKEIEVFGEPLGHDESDWLTCYDAEGKETGYEEKICNVCKMQIVNQKKSYTITFISNGGTNVGFITDLFDSIIEKPQNPTREGFIFKGWYLDNNTFEIPFFTLSNESIGLMPIGGTILYAKWEEWSGNTFTKNQITYRDLGNDEYEIVKGNLYNYYLNIAVNQTSVTYNVVSIADDAFNGWTEYTTYKIDLTLPKSVRTIGQNAFKNSRLRNIYFEPGSELQSIGDNAFSDNNLVNYVLRLPEGLKSIGNNAFNSDNSDKNYIQTVYIPSTLQHLGSNVFDGQTRLSKVICTSEKISNNENYIDLISKISTFDSLQGEFTWVEDILFFKAHAESFARLVYYNRSGLYTKTIKSGNVNGDYEVLKMPKFKYDYIIESFTFFDIFKIHGILFPQDVNVIQIDSYAFGNFRQSAGNPATITDNVLGTLTPYPNFLFSSDINWKNVILAKDWLYLNSSGTTFCAVEVCGTSVDKTDELLNCLNNSLSIEKDINKFCITIDAAIYGNNQPDGNQYKFAGILHEGIDLIKYL